MAAVDADGQILNAYTGHRRTAGDEPDRPWAVYLAGPDSRYRLLCFDLDAKTPDARHAAARDADVLAGLLHDAGLPAVVCESGPSGGRHVWAALAESVDADTTATLARLARHLCPTLDLAPLTNPATGCARPPGAPHRAGGHSVVLTGNVTTLTAPTGTRAQVIRLVENVAQLVDDAEPARAELTPHAPLPVDEHARLYLPGPRRPLPAFAQTALEEDAAAGDASAVLWRILIGAAAARWRHADIAALADTSPGLEHVRSTRDRGNRHPRGRYEAAGLLRRQWDKAVRHVATRAGRTGEDPTFDPRADAIATTVRSLQARAAAAGGRWTTGGGPADRRILDALSVLTLQALSAAVEADTRRLALMAGIGRETARTALLRLSQDGWIAQAKPAEGPHGAIWTIDPTQDIHKFPIQARSQADPRPAGAGSAERSLLLTTLTTRLTAAAHDLFTPSPGLGHLAGNLYAHTSQSPLPLLELADLTGATPPQVSRAVDALQAAGVLLASDAGYRRPASDTRRAAATRAGITGRLAARTRRYTSERAQWAWWQAEHAWMTAPRRLAPHRRPGPGQLTLLPDPGTNAYGAYPRRSDGRADHHAARQLLNERAQPNPNRRRSAPLSA
ncbi:hypothetical protein [Tersicoccus sp. Bi-70]|uniref:hypothetical protein n=1 Tax=Tersicoccus sp. Bi-70 TaxID=1897634 RepID=UPI0009769F33|nr:hypothetical protein [Tersicoccus sp. Bi-70]OMH32541.1 hypothetical protein BGP79_06955 [Tersicoccus sp. Bi-70]